MNPTTQTSPMEASAHPFDQAVQLRPAEKGRWLGQTSAAYANMVGPFGGITAAQAFAGVLRHPGRLGDPIALTINFATALSNGEFEVLASPVRTNRSTQHWAIELRQQDAVVLTGSAVTAARRATWNSDELAPPAVPPADALASAQRKRPCPAWVERYDMRFVEGDLPIERSAQESSSRSLLWLRDEPPRPLDFMALAAIADAFFPRIMVRRGRFVPIGTVSLTTYFHADAAQLAAVGSSHILGAAAAAAFRDGYFDQTARLWSAAGALLASSHQIVYYKE